MVEGRKFPLFIDYISVKILFAHLEEIKDDTGKAAVRQRQIVDKLLPLAIAYDQACEAALIASAYAAKVAAVSEADYRMDCLKRELADTPAQTPLGITIKAQAYQASSALGREGVFQASIHLGPSIADDVCRILSEADTVTP